MESGAIAAVFVSVLGFFLIIAAVWLFYKWQSTRHSIALDSADTQPVNRYVVHRGQLVPASRSRRRPTSVRSGWSSIRRSTWFLSAVSLHKSDSASVRGARESHYTRSRPFDPELGTIPQSPKGTSQRSSTNAASRKLDPDASRGASTDRKWPVNAQLHPLDCAQPPVTPRNKPHRSMTGPSTPMSQHTRTFLESPSIKSPLGQTFPKPAYLSPLQSRFQRPPADTRPRSKSVPRVSTAPALPEVQERSDIVRIVPVPPPVRASGKDLPGNWSQSYFDDASISSPR